MNRPGCSTHFSSEDALELPEILSVPTSPVPKAADRHPRPTECSVCGKAANGYHYDVPSCNGCKTFFRRLLVSERNFSCKASGDCFDFAKRKVPLKCRACRYEKCISAGMNPLAMEVDEKEASTDKFKQLARRRKKEEEAAKGRDDDVKVIEPHEIPAKQMGRELALMEHKMQKMIDMLTYLETKVEMFRMSKYNPHWLEFDGLEHLIQIGSRISLADRYGPMPGWPLSEDQIFVPPPLPPPSDKNLGPPPLQHKNDVKHWFFYNLMTNVEYAKTFMFYNKLSSRDKLVLSRYVTLACLNLHISYSTVSKKSETIHQPDGSKEPFLGADHYSKVVMSLPPLIRCGIQKIEYVLLKAICLCNPVVPDLSDAARILIGKERAIYADALFEHCLRSRPDGPAHFAELLGVLDVLERQQRMQKDYHLLHIGPLVAKFPKEHTIQVIEDIMDN